MLPFEKFNKIPRLSRDMVITEKIDGSNGQIYIASFQTLFDALKMPEYNDFFKQYTIAEEKIDGLTYYIFAGSRNRWLSVDNGKNSDNHGFAKWVKENASELFKLGEGRHYGEWYGKGIQRGYELDEKRFALFNVNKWYDPDIRPKCCEIVPAIYEGLFDTNEINRILEELKLNGSYAVSEFMNPEGIVIYHKASGKLFKKTIVGDEKPKGKESNGK
jgi:hypothetical protein